MNIYVKSNHNGGIIRVGNKSFSYKAFSILDSKIVIYGKTRTELYTGKECKVYKNGSLIFKTDYSVSHKYYKKK